MCGLPLSCPLPSPSSLPLTVLLQRAALCASSFASNVLRRRSGVRVGWRERGGRQAGKRAIARAAREESSARAAESQRGVSEATHLEQAMASHHRCCGAEPICAAKGQPEGAVCGLDSVGPPASGEEREAARAFVRMVARAAQHSDHSQSIKVQGDAGGRRKARLQAQRCGGVRRKKRRVGSVGWWRRRSARDSGTPARARSAHA